MTQDLTARFRTFFPLFIIMLLVMAQACSSVPLMQSDDPDDRLKGIRKEAESIRSLGERYWIRSLSFWDKNDIVKRLNTSGGDLGRLSRQDKDARVRTAAEQQLAELFKSENPLIRLVAFREIRDQQTIQQAVRNDALIEVRCIAAARLKDPKLLEEVSRTEGVVGRIARVQRGLTDPVVQKQLTREPDMSVESETRYNRFNEALSEGYFVTITIKAGEKVLAKGEEHSTIKTRTPMASGQMTAFAVGYPLGGSDIIAKIKANEGKQKGMIKRVELNPSEILYNVLVNSALPVAGANEIIRASSSDDLKQAAVRAVKNSK